jgi:serine/threonine protein kinase
MDNIRSIQESSMSLQLAIFAGPDQGRILTVSADKPLLIGRGRQSATRLSDLRVSRVHCRVEVKGTKVLITDLDSSSGTFVNGKRVARHELQPDEVLQVGDTRIRLQIADVAELPTLPPADAAPNATTPLRPKVKRTPPLAAERLGELTGSVLAHFQVGRALAKGRSGIVFHAYDFQNDRTVALKVLRSEFARDPQEVQRFIRAMRTTLPLQHPNLITLYSAGKKQGYCWIAMEYVEGESLTQVLKRIGVAGMLDWRNAFRVAVHIGRALQFAHERHILHRNLTPQNVLVRKSDKVTKLGDLMLAKALEGTFAQQITQPGEILGDVHYMSPERTRGAEEVDERSDLYSLGALLYALLAGRTPFETPSLVATMAKIRDEKLPSPRTYQLSIPDKFAGLVMMLLAKRPENRYQSATELLAELDKIGKFQGMTV